MKERWRFIEGYEGLYQVSNTGKVRRVGKCSNQHTSWETKRELKPGDNGRGYKFVNLSKNNKVKSQYVHRLVAEAFIDKPEVDEYLTVNHKDGNKSNNVTTNLEWATYSQNNQHSYDKLKRKTLKNNPKVSKSVIQLDMNEKEINRYPSIREAGRQNDISSSSISAACRGIRKTAGGYKWQYQKV